MRGTLQKSAAPVKPNRFIPAGAGNTVSISAAKENPAVHPRRCGEHSAALSAAGSSPQVRGTPVSTTLIEGRMRFIPAGAGNTTGRKVAACRGGVHPRRCGEHGLHLRFGKAKNGSSPQVRGTPRSWTRHRYSWRFIPAGAGNTPIACASMATGPVHPRRCGEHGSGHS